MKYIIYSISLILALSIYSCTPKASGGSTQKVEIQTSAQCGMCESTLEKALYKVPGVKQFTLNLENQMATVVYNSGKTDAETIREAISKAGYDADNVPADAQAYEGLNPCCKKGAHIPEN